MEPSTRDRVLDAAAALVADGGTEALRVSALTAASGVSNGSVYHHFGAMQGVLLGLLQRALSRYQRGLIAALEAHADDPAGGIRAAVAHHLAWTEAHPADAALLLEHRDLLASAAGQAALHEDNRAFLAAVSDWLAAHGDAGAMPGVGVRTAHALVFAPAQEIAAAWLRGDDPAPPTTHAERLGAAAWAALQAAGPDPEAAG